MGLKLKLFVLFAIVAAGWYFDAPGKASLAANKTSEKIGALRGMLPFSNASITDAPPDTDDGEADGEEGVPVELRFVDAAGRTYPLRSLRVSLVGDVTEVVDNVSATSRRKLYEGYNDVDGMVRPSLKPGRYALSVEPYSYDVLVYPVEEERDIKPGVNDVLVHRRGFLAALDLRGPDGVGVDEPVQVYSNQKYYFTVRAYGDGEVICPRLTIRSVSGSLRGEDQVFIWLLSGGLPLPAALKDKIIYNKSYELGEGITASSVLVLQAERIYSDGEADLVVGDCLRIEEKKTRLKLSQ